MICDSCQDGSHDECDGNAWDDEDERWRVCKCDNDSHLPVESVKKRRRSMKAIDPNAYPGIKLQRGQNVFADSDVATKERVPMPPIAGLKKRKK